MCCEEDYTICPNCVVDIVDDQFSMCLGCDIPTVDYATCATCQPKLHLSHAFVLGGYSNELKQLVRGLKYDHMRQVARDVAVGWQQLLPLLPQDAIVTPLPTASQRQRQRGFDQADLLAQALAAGRQLTCKRLLQRHGQTRQVGATRNQRFSQARSMFRLASAAPLEHKTILLVDDVITTGASLSAAAVLLQKAGAAQVMAVAIARQKL